MGLDGRDKGEPVKMRVIYRISNKCSYACRHCCYNSGPDGETSSIDNIKMVLGNLPKDTTLLGISGGEPFVVMELLYQMLEY